MENKTYVYILVKDVLEISTYAITYVRFLIDDEEVSIPLRRVENCTTIKSGQKNIIVGIEFDTAKELGLEDRDDRIS